MPNWVDTIMTIHGNSDDLRSFMEKAARPYTTYFKGQFIEPGVWDKDAIDEKIHDEPLSFMNFVSPTDTETYYQNQRELNHAVAAERWRRGVHNDDPCQHPTTCINTAGHTNKDDQNWYYWNVNNWGTKWDACNVEVTSDDLKFGSLEYRFSTAWSPAENAFRAMVQQHPELFFHFYNVEEQGWGVEYEGYDGKLHETNNWDIPDSDQD